jgi:hypothetical protein
MVKNMAERLILKFKACCEFCKYYLPPFPSDDGDLGPYCAYEHHTKSNGDLKPTKWDSYCDKFELDDAYKELLVGDK